MASLPFHHNGEPRYHLSDGSDLHAQSALVSEREGQGPEQHMPTTPLTKQSSHDGFMVREVFSSTNTADPENRPSRSKERWWWEAAASLISIASILSIVAILASADQKPLEYWDFYFKINTVVSALVTLAKSAMLFAVAACISQLKWEHFQNHSRPQPLFHLQSFDDASRGPWGALLFLKDVGLGSVAASVLAVVTIGTLFMDPAAQQMLSYPSRTTTFHNITAQIGQAQQWGSMAYAVQYYDAPNNRPDLGIYSPQIFLFQSTVMNAIFGAPTDPSFTCPSPATSCTFPEIKSMAICGSSRNITHLSFQNATLGGNGTEKTNQTWVFDYEGRERHENLVSMNFLSQLPTQEEKDYGVSGWIPVHFEFFRSRATIHNDSIGAHSSMSMTAVRLLVPDVDAEGKKAPPFEMLQSEWYLCEKTYSGVSVNRGKIEYGQVDEVRLQPVRSEFKTDPHPGTNPNGLRYQLYDYFFRAEEGGAEYKVTGPVLTRLWNFLGHAVGADWSFDNFQEGFEKTFKDDYGPYNMGYFLNQTDLAAMTDNIAFAVTTQIRGGLAGDNNETTWVAGEAFGSETYIHVKWPWIVVPLLETLLCALLLAVVMAMTFNRPLLKSSLLPFLANSIDGLTSGWMKGRIPEVGELKTRAQTIKAVLEPDENRWLRFKAEE